MAPVAWGVLCPCRGEPVELRVVRISSVLPAVHVPASIIGALLLGPGTNVTHQAMVLLTESGAATGDIDDLAGVTRRAMRDAFHESKLLTKCVQDIHVLLDAPVILTRDTAGTSSTCGTTGKA